jgi:hypothetical protein
MVPDGPPTTLLATADRAGWAFMYGLLVTAMGFQLLGAGHGVGVFFGVGLSGPILWPIAGAAIGWADQPRGKAAFLAAVWLHYLLAIAVIFSGAGDVYLERFWALAGWIVLAYVAVYVAGQVMLWKGFVSRARRARKA